MSGVLIVACSSGRGAPATTTTVVASGAAATTTSTQAPAVKFGTLASPCGPGTASGATDQGVTNTSITIGYGDDAGYAGDPGVTEMSDAVKAFMKWCNDQGGINGRPVLGQYKDAAVFNVVSKVQELCKSAFMLVGEGWALDVGAEQVRVGCKLVAVPAYTAGVDVANGPEAVFLDPTRPPMRRPWKGHWTVAAFSRGIAGITDLGDPSFGLLEVQMDGLRRLWGEEDVLVLRLREALAPLLPGRPRAGIAGTRFAATLAAARAGHSLISVPAGDDAVFLAPLPAGLLTPDRDVRGRLARFGLETIGAIVEHALFSARFPGRRTEFVGRGQFRYTATAAIAGVRLRRSAANLALSSAAVSKNFVKADPTPR